jgi:hypothetical protein
MWDMSEKEREPRNSGFSDPGVIGCLRWEFHSWVFCTSECEPS